MTAIHTEMPVLYRHIGTWTGQYLYVDTLGEILDRHQSRVTSLSPADNRYLQINEYVWDDGRHKTRNLDARLQQGRLWFDNDLILGWAVDDREESVLLRWRRKRDIQDNVNRLFHEMIQISSDNQHRCRTWHAILDGVLEYRVLITETRQSQ